jgi:hypothetical protein
MAGFTDTYAAPGQAYNRFTRKRVRLAAPDAVLPARSGEDPYC